MEKKPETTHLCEHGNCFSTGDPYTINTGIDESTLFFQYKTQYFCFKHAKQNGFCAACHQFFGGVESFEFNESENFCGQCLDELDHELGNQEETGDEDYDY